MKKLAYAILFGMSFFCTNLKLSAQNCSATVGTGTVLWSSLGLGACSSALSTNGGIHTGNVTINNLGGSDNLVIDINLTITGNLTIDANGSTPTVTLNSNINFRVTGNVNNAGNNVRYVVNTGSVLRVDGTLEGDNNLRFSGTGTILGGTLSLGNNADCLTPCPTISFTNCTSGSTYGDANYFCENFNTFMLPITLLNWAAVEDNQKVKLTWQTGQEKNNAYFSIEHSLDAFEWKNIAQIQGAGNSHTRLDYVFWHEMPEFGQNYYRLKQVDTDGSTAYSPIVSVLMPEHTAFAVYPNPSKEGEFWLKYYTKNALIQAEIYDEVGKLIQKIQLKLSLLNHS